MKRFNVTKAALSAVLFFALVFLLSSIGPLSNDDSVGHRVFLAFLMTFAFTGALLWLGRYDQDDRGPVVELPEATALRVDELLQEGQKVAAVKAVRDETGAGLQLAARTVEARRVKLEG